MADAEEISAARRDCCLFSSCVYVFVLVLFRFTRATQRRKHKHKHKKKERFPFLVLAFMLALMLASPRFTRCFLVLMLASYVQTSLKGSDLGTEPSRIKLCRPSPPPREIRTKYDGAFHDHSLHHNIRYRPRRKSEIMCIS